MTAGRAHCARWCDLAQAIMSPFALDFTAGGGGFFPGY